MSLLSDLIEYALDDATLAGLIEDRFGPDMPQGDALPALVYTEIHRERGRNLTKRSGADIADFQIDCWAETQLGAEALKAAAVNALDSDITLDYRFSMGSGLTYVTQMKCEGDRDIDAPPEAEKAAGRKGKSFDLRIWFKET